MIGPRESYNVVSYNLGGNADFAVQGRIEKEGQIGHNPEDLPPLPTDVLEPEELETFRNQLTKKILDESRPDLICLQESGSNDAPRDEKLKVTYRLNRLFADTNFAFFSGDEIDTAVVWDADKFECKATYGPDKGDKFSTYSIVDLKDKKTNQVIRMVSSHVPSMNLIDLKDGQEGDEDLEKLMKKVDDLNKKSPVDAVILGMDSNVPKDFSRRLEKVTNRKFVLDQHELPTNYNTKYKLAVNVDRIAVLSGKSEITQELLNSDAFPRKLIDTANNPSDHLPLAVKVNLEVKKSFMDRFFNK